MSLSKDLTVSITNEEEGLTLTIKTVSALGKDKVAVSGDPGVHSIEELKEALKAIEGFNNA